MSSQIRLLAHVCCLQVAPPIRSGAAPKERTRAMSGGLNRPMFKLCDDPTGYLSEVLPNKLARCSYQHLGEIL